MLWAVLRHCHIYSWSVRQGAKICQVGQERIPKGISMERNPVYKNRHSTELAYRPTVVTIPCSFNPL
jgi:hypothetical protein